MKGVCRLPAKGTNHIMPGVCCACVKPRVPARTRDCRAVNAKTRTRGVHWIRVFEPVACARRAAALGGDMRAGREAAVHPGPGWTMKIGGTSSVRWQRASRRWEAAQAGH